MARNRTYDGKNHRKYEMLGKRYGKLFIAEEIILEDKHHNGPVYRCVCDCGREVIKLGIHVRFSKNPSCGIKYCTDRTEKLYQDLYQSRIVAPSNRSGIPTDISFERYKELISAPCAYCKRVGVQTQEDFSTSNKKKKITDTVVKYNGIDQVIPRGGYTLDNVRTACFPCNVAKSNKVDGFLEGRMIEIHLFKPFRKYPDFSLADKIVWEPES